MWASLVLVTWLSETAPPRAKVWEPAPPTVMLKISPLLSAASRLTLLAEVTLEASK